MSLDGVLVIDKPAGLTSADVVARVKRRLGAARVGHTGTLDPMATGVLPIVLGEATKLAPFLLADDKAYDGEFELGRVTDTLDADGTDVARAPAEIVAAIDAGALTAAMARFVGEIDQIPPMHSALKQEGRRLYELARAGIEVDRPPRRVRVDRFELTGFAEPRATFHVACSKGTYVRSLVRDVGEVLGCGATLTGLRRTQAGIFTLAHAVSLVDVEGGARPALVPLAEALAHLRAVQLDAGGVTATRHGKPLPVPAGAPPGSQVRLLAPDGQLAAVCEVRGPTMAYLRVFHLH